MKLQGRNLSVRMRGEDVKELHRELQALDFKILDSEIEAGFFGKSTQQAVRQFQQQHDLEPAGVVNARTAKEINVAAEAQQPQGFSVSGSVRENNTLVADITVKAYDRDLRSETLLGEATTGSKGKYKITYAAEQFSRGDKQSADLLVRAYGENDQVLAASEIHFNAAQQQQIDLAVVRPPQPRLSEYEQFLAELTPALQDLPLAELTEDDITFLQRETALDRRHIERLVQSAVLGKDTELLTEVFYGLARQDLPLNLEALLPMTRSDLRKHLQTAIDNNLIPASLGDNLDDIMDNIEQVQFERGVWVMLDFFGRLLDQESKAPLAGFVVTGFDPFTEDTLKELGDDVANAEGLFMLSYAVRKNEIPIEGGQNGPEKRLRFHVFDQQNQEIFKTEIDVKIGVEQVYDLEMPAPAVEEPPSPTLEELDATLQLRLPAALLSRLANNGMRTLNHIRQRGGLSGIEGVDANDPAVRTLEAHARLFTLSANVKANARLIEKGHTDPGAVARLPRTAVVDATHQEVGDFRAARLQVEARAGANFLNNLITHLRTEQAYSNGAPEELQKVVEKASPPQCHCKNCKAAASPLAYLADLLDYAAMHLRIYAGENDHTGKAVSLEYLGENFHQPFGALPVSCEALDERVRQIRLCIEVLRSFLGARPLENERKEKRLANEEQRYRLAAYTTLLTKIGASYDELRLALGAEEEDRQTLADRLGLAVAHLDSLLLEVEALSEPALEQLFGLADTARDPLSTGAKRGDANEQLKRWKFDGVKWNRNTDIDGNLHLSLRNPAADIFRIKVYRDAARTALVASGEHEAKEGTVVLSPENGSGLRGSVDLNFVDGSEGIIVSAVPEFLSRRLQFLRTLWRKLDHPDEANLPNPAARRPIIDPDLIGPGDIRQPEPGVPAFDLWQERYDWVQERLQEARNLQGSGLDAILNGTIGLSLAKLLELEAQREQGTDIRPQLTELNLAEDAFNQLLHIHRLIEKAAKILPEEREEMCAILVQVQKRREFAAWRKEEQDKDILHSPDHFKIPQTIAFEFPPREPAPLPKWRATERDRRDWRDTLQSRLDQQQAAIDTLQEAVSATEEETLPMLRQALIDATGKSARILSESLLIDCENDGCLLTTRISQAIETIQLLLWSVRTAQLRDTHPDLGLDADDFDEEWKWIGAYETWRAAMLVFLYPENVLLPSLRRWQTPAFKKLVENLRNIRLLTPEDACEAAHGYAEYFEDICSLKIEATCQIDTRVQHGESCRDSEIAETRNLFHMFARGGKTNTIYWSAYDAQDESGYAQSFWQAVPGFENVEDFAGVAPYVISPQNRYIYVFASKLDGPDQKLFFTKYDLENLLWDAEPMEVDSPKDKNSVRTRYTAIVKQHGSETQPPHLATRLSNGAIYDRFFNADGTDWADEDSRPEDEMDGSWHILVNYEKGREFNKLCAMVEDTDRKDINFVLFLQDAGRKAIDLGLFQQDARPPQISYRVFGDNDNGFWAPHVPRGWKGEFVGAIRLDQLYVFWKESKSSIIGRTLDIGPANYEHTIKSFVAFDDWLKEVVGKSLREFPVSLNVISSVDIPSGEITFVVVNTDLLTAFQEYPEEVNNHAFLDARQSEIERQTPWRFANAMVKRLSRDEFREYSLIRVLHTLLHEHVVRFRSRRDAYAEVSAPPAGLSRLAARTGLLPNEYLPQFAFQLARGQVGLYQSFFHHDLRADLRNRRRIAPLCRTQFDIKEKYTDTELQARRRAMARVFQDNEPGPASNLVYLEEAFYFVPVHLALQLQPHGQYTAAKDYLRSVYDYSAAGQQRKIYFGLREENELKALNQRTNDWLLDPLNPHAIAATRRNTYTRFTLIALIRCCLEAADAEFTRDTAESVARARMLYMTALELLDAPELKSTRKSCEDLIIGIGREIVLEIPVEWDTVLNETKADLGEISDPNILDTTIGAVKQALLSEQPIAVRFAQARAAVAKALASTRDAETLAKGLERNKEQMAATCTALLALPQILPAYKKAGAVAGAELAHTVASITGVNVKTLQEESIELPWLGQKLDFSTNEASGENGRLPGGLNAVVLSERAAEVLAREAPLYAIKHSRRFNTIYTPGPSFEFCIPPNPILEALRLHAELNLYKIRTCRNIAGDERELEPYSAPIDVESGLPTIGAGGQLVLPGKITFRPTPFRYAVLIERAKQLAGLAQQIEASFLATVEKRDAEYQNLLRARQDVQLTSAGVRLQDLRVKEAEDGVTLAELQRERAEIQVEHFDNLLGDPQSNWEDAAIGMYISAIALHTVAAIKSGFSPEGVFSFGAGVSSELAAAASTSAQLFLTLASFERRKQEWELQLSLAEQDDRIGAQQIRLAEDHVRIVGQERNIAAMQAENAKEIADFLANKFTNVELYDWMSGVLEGVYSLFLQQATAMAQLAAHQLAFERQEIPPPIILSDYWEAPQGYEFGVNFGGKALDRRGLTGSSRLLQDITQLDQHAFETDRLKLQLTKTISLARLAPAEFQRFRETGVMPFNTTRNMFDRDFPGHYLRLVKRVRTSIIALIPPIEGIHATLASSGISRVVIGSSGFFQLQEVKRPPESIALSSPQNATGLFELQPEPEKLLPFEGMGVDTAWELQMPKAANQFDYNTIADVLVTIEYTALNSFDYRRQVVQELDRTFSADRPFSFRNEFADQFFDLNNPEQTAEPMVVRFETTREDFAPNVENLKIQQVVLFFSRKEGQSSVIKVTHLHFTEQGATDAVGGDASSIDGVISTRRGNASNWLAMIGKSPVGEWELALPNTEEMKKRFKDEEIEDILFVITCKGETPAWPA